MTLLFHKDRSKVTDTENTLILLGKLGHVGARVPDCKTKQSKKQTKNSKENHTEVQVKNKELLQLDLQIDTKRESVACIILKTALKSWQFCEGF